MNIEIKFKLPPEIGSLIEQLFGPIGQETGEYISEKIRFLRFKNTLNRLKKAKELVEKSGLPPHTIDLKLLLPLLEGCSLEEEETLQKKWEGLLASAATGDEIRSSYPSILSHLNPLDAKLLEYVFNKKESGFSLLPTANIEKWFGPDSPPKKTILISLDNLIRLRLPSTSLYDIERGTFHIPPDFSYVCITDLGEDFITKCNAL